MKNVILLLIFNFIFLISFCQTPQLINYQGVARDSAGHPLLNQNISLQLSILDSANNGPVIFVETHSVQTNGSGLFNINIGGGVNLLGLFSAIPWGKGNKWLKVDMDVNGGNNFQLIGKTQFLSVPYSFYSRSAEDLANVRVSVTGDTLFLSQTKWVKIPNISFANFDDGNACTNDTVDQAGNTVHVIINTNDYNACTTDGCNSTFGVFHTQINVNDNNVCTTDGCNSGNGGVTHIAVNTDDNNQCTTDGCHSISGIFHNQIIINDGNPCSIDACDPATGTITHAGSTATDFDGNVYSIISIGTQCWFSKNLNTAHYRNGDAIPTGLSNASWAAASSGAYGVFGPEAVYGKLYNWFTVVDSRNLCPIGYHIPSLTEITTLANALGGFSVAGGPLKEAGTAHWATPNTGATNSSGFTALPAGAKYYSDGSSFAFSTHTFIWLSTSTDPQLAHTIDLSSSSTLVDEYNSFKQGGFSIRCMKD